MTNHEHAKEASIMRLRSDMTGTVLTLALLTAAGSAAGQDGFSPNVDPSLHIRPAEGEIKVDGRIDDAGWKGVAVADNFCETSPGYNIKPPVKTEAYLTYDNDNLYVAMIGYDNPADVRGSLCERDHTQGDDNLGFHIDTYGDADWGYVFFVNRHGVQYDALWTADFGWDTGHDLIWESAGSLTDYGFVIEVAIPLASIRFPSVPVQNWKVNFVRYHEREVTHYFSWCAEDRDESCGLCQLGSVSGVENVKPGKGVELVPALTGFQSGSLVRPPDEPHHFDNLDPEGDLSLSAKYSLSSSATAEITVNPDFSQVEADANQIDVNTTTALSFPEKRPFFQEGADLFRTPYSIVHTRAINDPIVAAKTTARLGRTSLAYLGAYDESSPVIVPFEEFSSGVIDIGHSVSNIVRLRQSFGENSRVGLLATDRRYDDGGSGSSIGLDGSLRLSRNWSLNWQAIASHTEEPDDTSMTEGIVNYEYVDDTLAATTPATAFLFDDKHTAAFDGESYWGHANIAELAYSRSDFTAGAEFQMTNPTFRLDNGYQPENSQRKGELVSSYTFRFDSGLIESIRPDVSASRVWNDGGRQKMEDASLGLDLKFRWNQTNIHPRIQTGSEYYSGKQYDDLWTFHNCISISPSERLSFGGGINYGDRIARSARVTGRETRWWLWFNLQPVDQLLVQNNFDFVQSKDQGADEMLYDGFQVRSNLNYQFNRELSFRYVVQYSDFSETWDFDPLLIYQINPFTLFYIGATYDYDRLTGLNEAGTAYADSEPTYEDNKLTSRQYFMKLQYLFQM